MIPVFALFAVIADAWLLDIVVLSPAIALVDVVPITSEDVPAPMSVLISPADIFVLSDGSEPLDKTAGVPVSDTLAVLAVIADACAVDIVVMLPALAVVLVVPITKFDEPNGKSFTLPKLTWFEASENSILKPSYICVPDKSSASSIILSVPA